MSPRFALGVCLTGVFVWVAQANQAAAQTREEKVRSDRQKVQSEGYWLYNNLDEGFAQAKQSGKPLLVTFRCIPCEECVKLDEELMEQDAELKPLLDKFVRVRQISTNGLDLSLFQFDFDQSFSVFMLNADGTIYGRFGTRSHRTDWASDVSIKGLAAALRGALELHQAYPANKQILAGKRGEPLAFTAPEKYPLLRGKYGSRLDYDANVVQSCIHCHQVGDALRDHFIKDPGDELPERVLFQYPHPKILGLVIDPATKATLAEVTPNSPAAASGFLPGDELESLAGQPMLSIADIQWVLHNVANEKSLPAVVRRGAESRQLTLQLPENWRRQDELSWRVTSWPMRRMVLGGLVLEAATAEERAAAGVEGTDSMALRVKGAGRYGPHATARRIGFREQDILISYDGKQTFPRETELLVYGMENHKVGKKVPVELIRGGKKMTLMLPMQE